MIECYQCVTIQGLTLLTQACFLLQYAVMRIVTTCPSIFAMFSC